MSSIDDPAGDAAGLPSPPAEMPAVAAPVLAADLPCAAGSATEARRWVVDVCRSWDCGPVCEAAELVTAELVGNAIRHARTAIELRVCRTDNGVMVQVSDDSPRMPERREAGLFDESGRGLWLVDAMASRWGVERELLGKRIWAELTA